MSRCGCWDGPFSAGDQTLISVRCDMHADRPPLDGHVAMTLPNTVAAAVVDAAGRVRDLERRHGGKLPQQAPSVEVCVERCGSKCCRTPGMAVFLRDEELVALKAKARELGIRKLPIVNAGRRYLWRYDFAGTGGRCVFLDDEGLCRIYDDRPNACRVFPHRPVAGCLVWPDPDGRPGEGVTRSSDDDTARFYVETPRRPAASSGRDRADRALPAAGDRRAHPGDAA